MLLLVFTGINQLEAHSDNDMYDGLYGNRFAINDHMSVYADNNIQQFTIVRRPFSSNALTNMISYSNIYRDSRLNSSNIYIHNIATGAKLNNNNSVVAFIAETMDHKSYLIVMWIPITSSDPNEINFVELSTNNIVKQNVLGIDSDSAHIYVVQLASTLYYDVNSKINRTYHNVGFWDPHQFMIGEALAVTNDQRLFLLAYRQGKYELRPASSRFYLCLYTVDLSNVSKPISMDPFEWTMTFPVAYLSENREYAALSLDLNEESDMLIAGIASMNSVVIFSIKDRSKPPSVFNNHTLLQKNVLFGRSVALLNNDTYAVLAYATSTLPWSSSQIQFYSLDINSNPKPIFVFPNNQQPLPVSTRLQSLYRIIKFLSWDSNNIGLLLDPFKILLLPASPPGYCSSLNNTHENYMTFSVYKPRPCIPGTYKHTSGLGPCFICPTHSKNNGSSAINCERCFATNTSRCFPGAINEIDTVELTNHDQGNPYPISPESTQFDDLLLQNILRLPTTTKECLLLSPVFWACIIILVCLVFFLISKLIVPCFKHVNGQTILKNIFVRVDLIGEGQYWLGGLISTSLFVLIIFSCKFSISFMNLYPYEQSSILERISTTCDSSLVNAKFSSSLQLISLHKHQEEKPIFRLLEQQSISLYVQFISTAFTCDDLQIQQMRDHELSTPLGNSNCSANNSILQVSTTFLPQHFVTTEFELNGPHFVGGLRVCLSAPSVSTENEKYTAKQMDFCQFLFVDNQTIASKQKIYIKLIKIINRTASITSEDDDVIYSGLWLPTLMSGALTDELLFTQKGEHYRYLPMKTSLIVDISESEFFVKNTQEPIARTYEIIFNTILFSMLCLDLLGLLFIVFKMAIRPLISLARKRFRSKRTNLASSAIQRVDSQLHAYQY
ncbi:unnamed protein product [Adineta ricciae]|uniref:Transmembrane protein n=1 Tax=Adineta ricciae TaxID=249248 RepID=A0A814NLA4_ADIRI|nr:unnamed protein product [Adineta ricciae]CAF1250967.1 unnamed protein product [Adineta ricciae]